ncbi:MAG: type II toxin-antitoxin system RelE/ParE family toxin [Bacteroidales bacterium]
MRKIRWNKLAKEDYYHTIDYLLEEWSEKEAQQFIDDVSGIIHLLHTGNVDFQKTDYQNIRRCVVREQIILYYKILDKHTIELLRFWNTYQDDQNIEL